MAHDGWERILSELDKHALVGVDVDAKSGRISGHTTMGGAADSFYEYVRCVEFVPNVLVVAAVRFQFCWCCNAHSLAI